MKRILTLLLAVLSIAAHAQTTTFGGIGLRVNDSTAYRASAAAAHAAGYADIYWNNQAATKHYDIWNGAAYVHVFNWNGSGGGGGGGSVDWGAIGGTLADQTDLDTRLDVIESGKENLLVNSAGLRAALNDETGGGAAYFAGGNAGTPSAINLANGTALPAASVVVTPAGTISSTNADAALNELDTEKAPYRPFTLSGVFTDQPAYSASEGYYLMYPEVSGVIPRFYLNPNNPATNGTKWKFEGFHTNYLTGSTNYAGFNIFGSTVSGVHYTWIGPNTGGTGSRGLMVFGSFQGSSQEANTSELRMNINDSWNMRGSSFNYEALNGTDYFGINSSGALLLAGSAGTLGDQIISQGSTGSPVWGAASGSLNSTTTSTVGGTITLDMNSQVQRIHVASASISGPKTIAMSNATNALVFAFTIQVTNVAAVLTMPGNWVMSSVNFDGTAWTPPSTGFFKFAGTYDGSNWFVNVAGPYN